MMRWRLALAGLALLLAVGSAIAALLGGLGYRWGWWGLGQGFWIVRCAAYTALSGAGAAVLALIAPPLRGQLAARATACAAVVIAAGVLAPPWLAQRTADGAPAINDITTDTENAPAFVAIVPLRAGSNNPPDYPGADFAQRQRQSFPDILPAHLSAPPAEAFARARAAAAAMGWNIVAVAPDEGRIEATAETRWFGLKDDVVIRVQPESNGTRVDIRSKSRIGRGDRGMNAWRVREFLRRLNG